jgi:hypothetical protein
VEHALGWVATKIGLFDMTSMPIIAFCLLIYECTVEWLKSMLRYVQIIQDLRIDSTEACCSVNARFHDNEGEYEERSK